VVYWATTSGAHQYGEPLLFYYLQFVQLAIPKPYKQTTEFTTTARFRLFAAWQHCG